MTENNNLTALNPLLFNHLTVEGKIFFAKDLTNPYFVLYICTRKSICLIPKIQFYEHRTTKFYSGAV